MLGALDAHIRRRLRALLLRQWKRKRTIARRLIQLGVKPKTAWEGLRGAPLHVGAEPQLAGRSRTAQRVLRRARARVAGGTVEGASGSGRRRPGPAHAGAGIAAGGNAGDGRRGRPRTPASRRAGCEAHKSGSVRGAPGQLGAPTRRRALRAAGCWRSEHGGPAGSTPPISADRGGPLQARFQDDHARRFLAGAEGYLDVSLGHAAAAMFHGMPEPWSIRVQGRDTVFVGELHIGAYNNLSGWAGPERGIFMEFRLARGSDAALVLHELSHFSFKDPGAALLDKGRPPHGIPWFNEGVASALPLAVAKAGLFALTRDEERAICDHWGKGRITPPEVDTPVERDLRHEGKIGPFYAKTFKVQLIVHHEPRRGGVPRVPHARCEDAPALRRRRARPPRRCEAARLARRAHRLGVRWPLRGRLLPCRRREALNLVSERSDARAGR